MELKTNKRIVSKREYVLRRIFQGVLAISGTCTAIFFVWNSLATIIALFILIGATLFDIQKRDVKCISDILFWLINAVLGGGASWFSWRLTLTAKKQYSVNAVIPLTRANTAYLPATDSLVRASAEPLQVQQAVLLRAAAQGQKTPPEQLVRPAGGPE